MSATTKLLHLFFQRRLHAIDHYTNHGESIQRDLLNSLIHQSSDTEWGKNYQYHSIKDYETFQQRVPLQTYEEIKPYVERMMRGENNLLWDTPIKWFAKSSGTTNDKSKFIPVSQEALKQCHYRGGMDVVALYLRMNPQSNFFGGKGLILGGSFQNKENEIHYGDLSAILIENINPLIELIRVPQKKIALMNEWESKIQAIIQSTANQNITNISGVPSWFLVLIKKMLEQTGHSSLNDLWPNLEVFFHGGISFDPYREQYKKIITSDKMHYMETYNASEGFFGIQNDFSDKAMLLMIDLGIFFEFMPLEDIDKSDARAVPLWEVEVGRNYAIAISTNAGLWRYLIGDTVCFTQTNPYKFVITGRTKSYINAFGEELMVSNAEKAIAATCDLTGAVVADYTAAPTFMNGNKKGHHTWIIEFEKEPESLEHFADVLDQQLQNINSDYEAKRYKGIFLDRLELIPARRHLFLDWLTEKGKLGGQHKVPRLSNNRIYLEELLRMNR